MVEYMEVAEEGHYTGRQAEFEMGELFCEKPLRTEHSLYTKGVTGEQVAVRLNKENTVSYSIERK